MNCFRNIILIICIAVQVAIGQDVQIVDDHTGEPLIGAHIVDTNGQHASVTDIDGFVMLNQWRDTDTLMVTMIGYQDLLIYHPRRLDPGEVLRLVEGIYFDQDIIVLDRSPQQIRSNLPAHIETLNAASIQSSNAQTAADAVGKANGVFLQKSQLGGGSPMIRGFSANRILLVVDGVRMNNAIFRSGNLQNIISVDPHSLDRINVLLGPNSLKYGSDALGGVISMQTAKPKVKINGYGRLSGQYNSANQERTASLSLGYGGNRWAWSGLFSGSQFGDLKMGRHGRDRYLRPTYASDSPLVADDVTDILIQNDEPRKQRPTGYDQLFTQQQLSYEINNNSIINYSFYYSKTSDVPRYDRLIEPSADGLRNAQWYYGPQQWMMHKLNFQTSASKNIYDYITVSTAYQYYQESRHDRRWNSPMLRHRTEQLHIGNINVDATKSINKWTLAYGGEWTYNRLGSMAESEELLMQSTTDIQSRYPDGSEMMSSAGYLQGNYRLSDQFNFTSGVRFTWTDLHASINNDFLPLPFDEIDLATTDLSASIGVSYLPSEVMYIYTNLSSGFRTPNIDDVAKVFDSGPGRVVIPNNELAPEKVYSVEVGMESRYKNGINYHIGIYYMYLNNIISRQNDVINGRDSIIYDGILSQVQSLQNLDHGYIYGVEAKIGYSIGSDLKLRAQISYQHGQEIVDDQRLPLRHIAPLFGSVGVMYSVSQFELRSVIRFNGTIPYQRLANSERDKPFIYALDGNGNPFAPAWATWDIKARYKWGKWAVGMGVDNILDKRYRPYSSGIVAGGRGLILDAGWTF